MKKNMNRSFIARAVAVAAVLGFSGMTHLSAQSIVPASHPDLNIGNFGYSNVAAMEYSGPGNPQLTAIVEDDGPSGATSLLSVFDQTPGWFSTGLPFPPGSSSDVIVGNNFSIPGDYLIGVVANVGGNIDLQIYNVHNVGTGSLSINPVGAPLHLSITGTAIGAPHIDAIAKYSTASPGVLPKVDKFAVIWKDHSNGIVAYYSSLNTPGIGTTQVMNSNTTMNFPDVAAVERYNPGTGGYEDWALATYIDNTVTPNVLYYQEWAMSPSSAPSPAVIYDSYNTGYNTTYAPGVTPARIDAIDDYMYNTPGTGNATFVIAATKAHSVGYAIVEYNDLTGPYVSNDISTPVPGIFGRINILPVVACGPGNFYTVGYYSSGQNYYATSIDWNTGMPTSDPNAYEVPQTPFSLFGGAGWIYGIGLAATCNNDAPGPQSLTASFEIGGILYKKSTNSVAPYGFKHTNQEVAVPLAKWIAAPNPASDFVILSAPSGFDPGEHTTYQLWDVAGRVVANGTMKNTSEQITLSDLTSGMYFLNVYKDKSMVTTAKVVKE